MDPADLDTIMDAIEQNKPQVAIFFSPFSSFKMDPQNGNPWTPVTPGVSSIDA